MRGMYPFANCMVNKRIICIQIAIWLLYVYYNRYVLLSTLDTLHYTAKISEVRVSILLTIYLPWRKTKVYFGWKNIHMNMNAQRLRN